LLGIENGWTMTNSHRRLFGHSKNLQATFCFLSFPYICSRDLMNVWSKPHFQTFIFSITRRLTANWSIFLIYLFAFGLKLVKTPWIIFIKKKKKHHGYIIAGIFWWWACVNRDVSLILLVMAGGWFAPIEHRRVGKLCGTHFLLHNDLLSLSLSLFSTY
jgi:hypothetical protein